MNRDQHPPSYDAAEARPVPLAPRPTWGGAMHCNAERSFPSVAQSSSRREIGYFLRRRTRASVRA